MTRREAAIPTGMGILIVFAIAMGSAALIWAIVRQALAALTGLGIQQDAVQWPSLALGKAGKPPAPNRLPLPRKALLVAPQQAVRTAVSDPTVAIVVNLGAELLPASGQSLQPAPPTMLPAALTLWPQLGGNRPPRLVVTGLDLVLRSAPRRRAALLYLERAVRALGRGAPDPLAEIVLIAEMSPLERILDAFETREKTDDERDSLREELRWARLFHDFTTFCFVPIDKLNLGIATNPAGLSGPSRALAEEVRWLPGSVIDSVIGVDPQRPALTSKDGVYPIPDGDYQSHYTDRIVDWARGVAPSTTAGAIEFMRANLIEHYEQCWAASSLSERFIIDALAHGAFVNMRKSIALQSLIRRGLVILDPAPRLMNASFALFIVQTERPNSLEEWRKLQPRSAWSAIRLPLGIAMPVLVLGIGVAAAESGQQLTTIISLLAAGIPALLGTMIHPKSSQ